MIQPQTSKRPPIEELREAASRMTASEAAARYGVSPSTIGRWKSSTGVSFQKDKKRPQNYSAIERIVGTDPEAIRAWIVAHSIEEASEILGIDYVNTGRNERVYGARFLRTCKNCGQAKPYADMRQRQNGMIYKICSSCWIDPNRGKVLEYRDEAHRLEEEPNNELRRLCSLKMGKPMGGTGWHNAAGIEMARGQYA